MNTNNIIEKQSNISKKRSSVRLAAGLSFLLIFLAFMLAGAVSYRSEKENIIESFQKTAMQVRDSIIDQIHYDSFSEINDKADMDEEVYIDLQEKLNSVRIASSMRYLYTAQVDSNGTYIYVVDGLSVDAADFAYPGTPIEQELFDYMEKSLEGQSVMSDDFMDTEWGKICTAYFPIYDTPGEVYGVLCMELDMEPSARHLDKLVLNFLLIALFASALISFIVALLYNRLRTAQDAVHEANENMTLQLETILSGVSGGFKISNNDEKYSYAYVSEAAAAIQGYTVDEFMKASNGNAVDNVYPPDLDGVLEDLAGQYARGNTYSCRYRVVHKDGSLRWIVDNGRRIISNDGQVLNYSLYQDVTEFQEQNIELKNTLFMLEQMLSLLGSGILAYSIPEYKLLQVNKEAMRMFNIKGEATSEALSERLQNNIMPYNREGIMKAVNGLKKPGDSVSYMFRVNKDDGGFILVHTHTKLLEFEDGSRFILSSMWDITEQHKLEELLRRERKQYRDALTYNCEYSYSFDVTDGIIYSEFTTIKGINPFRVFNLEPPVDFDEFTQKWVETYEPHFINSDMKELLHCGNILKKFEEGARSVEIEYYTQKTDKYTRVITLLSRDDDSGHVLGFVVASDTTKSRREEEIKRRKLIDAKAALQDAYERANRASAAKTHFLSNMSHEIRTPMNAIIGMTAIAGAHLDDKEKVAYCLNKITISSKHLLGLINEVLDMSKIESGKMSLNDEEFSLPELIDTLLTMSKSQVAAKHHELSVSIQQIEHENVIGDSQRIQQAFLNLLGNAIKYTPDGGTIKLSISEKKTNKPRIGCYEFIFEDNGIGMSEEYMEHLFEPFSRADDERVEKVQGTGLGMPITRNIVQMMNGSINVESKPNVGTKFTVTIYLKLQDEEENISYEDFIDLPVLVADDDRTACESTCILLDDLGMKSEWVLSGEEAVALTVQRHNSDDDFFAVIIDWKMPGMDGLETTREIRRQIGNDVPIIIISAYDWSDIESEARQAGVNAFISKPLFKSRMVHLFKELLGDEVEQDEPVSLEALAEDQYTGHRVLLVEDNDLNAEIAGEILGMTGLDIDYARNGKEALDIVTEAEDGYYDIIFMDVQMPVMDGYEATRSIRSLPRRYAREVPIIAMTANVFAEDVQNAENVGMNEYITKPLDLEHLKDVLRKYLA